MTFITEMKDVAVAASPLVALVVGVGSWVWQRSLQKRALQQSLYEKRYAVFEAFMDFAEQVSNKPYLTADDVWKVSRSTDHCQFLFRQDVQIFRDKFLKHARDYGKAINVGQDNGELLSWSASADAEMWFTMAARPEAVAVFQPYLQLSDESFGARWRRFEARLDGVVKGPESFFP